MISSNILDNLGKKVISDLSTALARDSSLGLVSNFASNAINNLKRISREGVARAWKGFTFLFQMKIWMILIKS